MSVYSNDRDPNDISWERENSKEVLHTQGEWGLDEQPGTASKYRFYSTTDGSNIGWFDPDEEQKEAGDANAELIVKAVNNYQKLLDSNRELLAAAKDAIATLDRWQEHDNEAWDERDDATYNNLQTAINNAKNLNNEKA